MAGEEGFEPSHAGIKIRCLNQLGDSPIGSSSKTRQSWQRVPLQSPRDESAHRRRATLASTARASASVANSANTHAPEPVMRACGRRCRSHCEVRRDLRIALQHDRPRDRSRPSPAEKGRYFERFRISCQCVSAENFAAWTRATGGTSTRYQAGGSTSARQPLADAFGEGVLAEDEERHVGAELQRQGLQLARAPGRAPQPVQHDQRGGRIRAAAAQAAADRQVLLQREVGAPAACRSAALQQPAPRARTDLSSGATPGSGSWRRISPSLRAANADTVAAVDEAEHASAAGGSRRRAGRATCRNRFSFPGAGNQFISTRRSRGAAPAQGS